MNDIHFPGRPTQTLNFHDFKQRMNGKDMGNPGRAFRRHVVELMRLHSGTADKFVTKYLNITYVRYYQIIHACELPLAKADVIKELLNVDMSVFMAERYPPSSRPSAA